MGGDEAGKSTLMYTFKNHGKAPSEFPSVLLGYDTVKVEYPIGWEFTLVDVWGKYIRKEKKKKKRIIGPSALC